MTYIERLVYENLKPIFPNHTEQELQRVVLEPNNHGVPLNEATLLTRCVDSLLLAAPEDVIGTDAPAASIHGTTIDLVSPDPVHMRPFVIDGGFVGEDNFEGLNSSVTFAASGEMIINKPKTIPLQPTDLPDIPPIKKRPNKYLTPRAKEYISYGPDTVKSKASATVTSTGSTPGTKRKAPPHVQPYQFEPLARNAHGGSKEVTIPGLDLLAGPVAVGTSLEIPAVPPVGRTPPWSDSDSNSPVWSAETRGGSDSRDSWDISTPSVSSSTSSTSSSNSRQASSTTYSPVPSSAASSPSILINDNNTHNTGRTQGYDNKWRAVGNNNGHQIGNNIQIDTTGHYQANINYNGNNAQVEEIRDVFVSPVANRFVGVQATPPRDHPTQAALPQQPPALPQLPPVKTPEDYLNMDVNNVSDMFPTIEPTFILNKLQEGGNHPDRVAYVCNHILENYKDCPQKPKPSPLISNASLEATVTSATSQQQSPLTSGHNYYEDISEVPSVPYRDHAIHLLSNEFKKISKKDIRHVFSLYNSHYAPTRRCFEQALCDAGMIAKGREISVSLVTGETDGSDQVAAAKSPNRAIMEFALKVTDRYGRVHNLLIKTMKNARSRSGMANFKGLDAKLKEELTFIKDFSKQKLEETDAEMAATLNQEEYDVEGQGIECGCCFCDCPFEKMVQCYEGHLFCSDCLKCYAKEAVFGQGKAGLECMTDGCDASYPKSQLILALPKEMLEKYEDRCQEEAINLADMDDLVRCPHCDFAALLAPDSKVFQCQNTSCMKETCRHCKEDWAEHFGIPCSELEKKDETKLRLAYEEKMTKAKVRFCFKCKTAFTKSDGCNKMTCRCGAKMCYICRSPNIDYNHFCQHPRDPGHSCKKCAACSLWTNPDEDDDRAVKEIQEEAEKERLKQGYSGDKKIGAPVTQAPPAPKRQRTH